MTATTTSPSSLPVLLATRDDQLLGDVLRLAAAAGTTLEVAHDPGSALRSWTAAALVLVGADLAEDLSSLRPARHHDVHVLGPGPVPDRVFRAALGVGARDVVELPAGESWLVDLLGDVVDGGEAAHAPVLGVLSGSGGSGASTFAAAAGQVAARSTATVLLDLDPWGPGLGRLLGYDEVQGIRWDAVASAGGRLASRSLRAALPDRDGLALLTYGAGPPPRLDGASVREVVAAARRGGDRIVVDLPRTAVGALEDEPGAAALAQCDRVVLVVAGTVSGVASAARIADRLGADRRSVGLVVRGVAAAVGPDEAAEALGLPLVAEYPSRRRVVEQVDLGLGPVQGRRSPLARAAADVLAWAGAVS